MGEDEHRRARLIRQSTRRGRSVGRPPAFRRAPGAHHCEGRGGRPQPERVAPGSGLTRRRVDADEDASAARVVDVLIHRQDAHAERQARAAELLDPDPDPNLPDPGDGAEVLDLVRTDEVVSVGVALLVEDATPAHRAHPERADGPLEEQEVARVVEDLERIEIVEVDAVDGLVEAHGRILAPCPAGVDANPPRTRSWDGRSRW